ncbi:MAG: tetratricopeptide repeat protein [Burkholderiales bacterium]|nr:tetratricopeptide repeat protein [Burkholderiales bacterium]
MIDALLRMLDGPRDGAMLRFSLGQAYMKAGDAHRAATYFNNAVTMDPNYSAAWKGYAQALVATGDQLAARATYRQGIEVATRCGDLQAAREMTVFLRRLDKLISDDES